jgi:hypothetical protein
MHTEGIAAYRHGHEHVASDRHERRTAAGGMSALACWFARTRRSNSPIS